MNCLREDLSHRSKIPEIDGLARKGRAMGPRIIKHGDRIKMVSCFIFLWTLTLSLGGLAPSDPFAWGGPPTTITGGEPKGPFGSGYQTDAVTEPETWRWAEHFYGFKGIDEIKWMRDGCGQWHNYVIGWHEKDLAEYLMKFGGDYSRLVLRGIADRPGPVELAVSIDGQYRATVAWNDNNDCNQDVTVDIPGVPYGTHAIGIRFVNDYWKPEVGRDRNMYLDALFVAKSTVVPSLTGGLPRGAFGSGHQSDEVTEPETWRWAEHFYGFKGIDEIKWMRDGCGQWHNYVIGWHEKDLAEYLMKFGGDYCRLMLRGKADRPGPVKVNIYIDGETKATTGWAQNDNCTQEIEVEIPGIPYGLHAIAIAYTDDYWNPKGGADGDRNLYLDGLRVTPCGGSDTEPPVVTITDPPNHAEIVGGTPLIRIEYSDNRELDLGSFQVSINGVESTDRFTVTETHATYQVTTPLPAGMYTISASIRDTAGNTTTSVSEFTVTYPPPSVSITALPDTIFLDETSVLSWTSTDATEVVIEPGIGPVEPNGSTEVSPRETTTYTITATGPGGTATDTVTVTIANSPPVAQDQSVTTDEDTSIDIIMEAVDREDDPLTYAIVTAPSHGTLSGDDGDASVSYAPNPDFVGSDAFTFRVNDGHSDSNVATVDISVSPVNDPPLAIDDAATTEHGTAVDIDVLANDTDIEGDPLTVAEFTQGSAGTVSDKGSGVLTYLPNVGFSGIDHFTYTVADGQGGTAAATVAVTVLSPITLTITAPSDGDSVFRPDVMVEGTVRNSAGHETGVTVNGVTAPVSGDRFLANHVPLQEGENIIRAAAIDTEGNAAETWVTVHAAITGDTIRLSSSTNSGVSPLQTILRIEGPFDFAASWITYVYQGPSQPQVVLERIGENEFSATITTEGTYTFTATATDSEDVSYTDTLAIVVLNPSEVDSLLKAKWNGMKGKLVDGDIEGALEFFASRPKQRYRQIFEFIEANVPGGISAEATNLPEPILIEVRGDRATYVLVREEDGKTIEYTLYFLKDTSGIWRVYEY
jgi:hypothetical protein